MHEKPDSTHIRDGVPGGLPQLRAQRCLVPVEVQDVEVGGVVGTLEVIKVPEEAQRQVVVPLVEGERGVVCAQHVQVDLYCQRVTRTMVSDSTHDQ